LKFRAFWQTSAVVLPRLRDRGENDEREAAIAVAERFADGLASEAELRLALPCSRYAGSFWAICVARAWEAANFSVTDEQIGDALKVCLLRCIFGNPFRPIALEPAWLTADVLALARDQLQTHLLNPRERHRA